MTTTTLDAASTSKSANDAATSSSSSAPPSKFVCDLCTGEFSSRNKLFKHLRSLNTECGAWCEAQGGIMAAAVLMEKGGAEVPRFTPPVPEKFKPPKKKRVKGEKMLGRPPPKPKPALPNELWVGGFPAEHASCKALKVLLWKTIPGSAGIAQPVVRMVVRKGWRDKKRKGWIGYGFVQFRDAEEAAQALTIIEGATPVEGVRLKASPSTASINFDRNTARKHKGGVDFNAEAIGEGMTEAEVRLSGNDDRDGSYCSIKKTLANDGDGDGGAKEEEEEEEEEDDALQHQEQASPSKQKKSASRLLSPGEDPTFEEVLRAWPQSIIASRAASAGITPNALLLAAAARESTPRSSSQHAWDGLFDHEERRVSGAVVPAELYGALLHALETARWPPVTHRHRVESERYLVVTADIKGGVGGAVDPYHSLKTAAADVMSWADPDFIYDHLAITRNFVGSPHVDREDTSYQYAVALGDYGAGGELVVESDDGKTRWVVDTRGKIGRVDGRYVHWVRGYDRSGSRLGGEEGGGTRYSVIYYMNKPRHGTERTFAVDENWTPKGGGGGGDLYSYHRHYRGSSAARCWKRVVVEIVEKNRGTLVTAAAVACSVVAVCGILMATRKLP